MCIWGCQLFVAFKQVIITAQSMLEYEIKFFKPKLIVTCTSENSVNKLTWKQYLSLIFSFTLITC